MRACVSQNRKAFSHITVKRLSMILNSIISEYVSMHAIIPFAEIPLLFLNAEVSVWFLQYKVSMSIFV